MPRSPDVRLISPVVARRLAVARQRLCAPTPFPDAAGMMAVIRDLGCVQLDPISVVAPSHRLVLWSRLGAYDPSLFDQLLWRDRLLFEYWAHAASIVLTEDYPIHRAVMGRFATGSSAWNRRVRAWVEANPGLRRSVLRELRRRGPLRARDLEDRSEVEWRSGGWTSGRDVDRMLGALWSVGEIMVAGRAGGHRLWDLRERVLPGPAIRGWIGPREAVSRAAQRSLRALGAGTAAQINRHFIRGEYPGLPTVLTELERQGRICRIAIVDRAARWPGTWFLHADDLPLLDAIERGDFRPRTTLLSPFDNLICDRARTSVLFGFEFRVEIYVPPQKRRFGYYVLPVLQGDCLIGRIDAAYDRVQGRLLVHAVHTEPGTGKRDLEAAIAEPLQNLAGFLEATGRRWPAPPSATRTSGSSRSPSSAARRQSSPIAAP